MDNKKHRTKPIIVEVPEELVGIQLIFRLKKGGETLNLGTVKGYERTQDGILLKFDPEKPGLGKYVGQGRNRK